MDAKKLKQSPVIRNREVEKRSAPTARLEREYTAVLVHRIQRTRLKSLNTEINKKSKTSHANTVQKTT